MRWVTPWEYSHSACEWGHNHSNVYKVWQDLGQCSLVTIESGIVCEFLVPGCVSDHSLDIVSTLAPKKKLVKPFKFFNIWSLHDKFDSYGWIIGGFMDMGQPSIYWSRNLTNVRSLWKHWIQFTLAIFRPGQVKLRRNLNPSNWRTWMDVWLIRIWRVLGIPREYPWSWKIVPLAKREMHIT